MSNVTVRPQRAVLGRTIRHWSILIALSAVLVVFLEAVHVPAALLLAPMAAAVVVASRGLTLRIPAVAFFSAQAVIGCMIAHSITPSILGTMLAHWPLFFGTILAVLLVSSLLGWLLARWQVLPGSVAVWGSSPGMASAMAVMAGAHGADMRLVAFMQYLRVVFVALTASLVAGLWPGPVGGSGASAAMIWFPTLPWLGIAETMAVIVFGGIAGRLLRIPAGAMLVPLALAAVLQGLGIITITLPPWFLAMAYLLVGWNIGLRFTPAILSHAAKALPRVAAATVVQIVFCMGLAFLLTRFAGIDPLTAYLATSPGGADSVAIIAASSKVDLPFVMAMQTLRLILVIAVSPSLARFVARHSPGDR